ncbi:MAG: NAD-dependent epimerase/dehydratase family protein [Anaerolineaceae bacterium]|nr:MAG: NAD-dependent epimerase/dehydratase family protein [Anaerolineaceae bacterium]
MKKKIVITGGAGFIGSHLVNFLLKDKHEIIVIDDFSTGDIENLHPDATLHKAALENIDTSILEGVDIIFHLASISGEAVSFHSPNTCFLRNIQASCNLLRCCIEAKVKKIVFTSSMAVYGNRQTAPFSEDLPCNPTDPYGVSKQTIENLIRTYGNLNFFEWNILRLHTVYGSRMNLSDPYRGVTGIFISQALQKKAVSIYGDGMQTRAFTFVEDIIPNIAKSGLDESINKQILNLGSGRPWSLINVAKAVFEILGEPENISFFPQRMGEAKDAFTTSQRAREVFGDLPETDFRVGLASTIAWAKTKNNLRFNAKMLDLDLNLGESPIPWLKG